MNGAWPGDLNCTPEQAAEQLATLVREETVRTMENLGPAATWADYLADAATHLARQEELTAEVDTDA